MSTSGNALCVQFSDASGATIISYFGCPQDPVAWPNQGTVLTSDARWKAYLQGIPELFQVGLPPFNS